MEKPTGYNTTQEQNKIKKVLVLETKITEKPTTQKGINELAENNSKIDKDKKESDNSIFRQLQKPMTRRSFLEIAAKAMIGLTTGYVVKKEIDSLREEYQKENTSDAGKESKELQTSTDLLGKIAEYPEMIEKSEKQTLNEFAEDLSKKDFDSLIFGEWHGYGPTTEKAVYLLEELIKNNKKISAICLEGLTYTDPEQVEATKKFNKGELSTDEMAKFAIFREPILELARKYSIEIMGIEKEKTDLARNDWYGRFREISERIGKISKEKTRDGVVVTYIGQGHVTIDSWENDNMLDQLAKGKNRYPSEKEALENNYTIKEYLEKINFKPVAVQIEDWQKLTNAVDSSLVERFGRLSPNEKKTFYDRASSKWPSFILKERDVFVAPYPKAEENTYVMIIPGKISDKPPKLSEKMGK